MPESMSEPLISVMMVTYNSQAFVRQGIESILNSTYENFELIIGDDCSTDNTWNLINSFSDSRIVSYRNVVNEGEYVNRNKAFSLVRGKYAIYIDGDDMIYPHGLEFMVNQVKQFPQCGMVLMHAYLNWMFMPAIITPKDFYLSNYLFHGFNNIAFTNTLFLTKALQEISGIPSKYRTGDVYVRLRIAATHQALIIQDQLTWWRETPGQASIRISRDVKHTIENFEMHREVLHLSGNVLTPQERQYAFDNELVRFREALLQYIKRLHFQGVILLLKYLSKEGKLLKLISAKKHLFNPFLKFNASNPMSGFNN